MELGKKLLYLRKRRGMSQQDLAEKLDVSRQSVSKWELGTAAPSTENLINIGKLFGVSVDALVDDRLQLQNPPVMEINEGEAETTDLDISRSDGGSVEDLKKEKHDQDYKSIVQVVFLIFALSVFTFLSLDMVENLIIKRTGTPYFYVPLSMISEALQVIGCGAIGLFAGMKYKHRTVTVFRTAVWTVITVILLLCTIEWCVFYRCPFDYFRTSISDQLYFQSIIIQFLFAKVTTPIIAPAFLCCDILFWCAIFKNRHVRESENSEAL